MVTLAPLAKESTPLTVVGTSTWMIEPFSGSLADGAGGATHRGLRRDAPDRTEQIDELRDVVRADVQHRAASALEKELRVRVPMLHAVRGEESGAGDRPTDSPRVDRAAAGLVSSAEEGVGRTTHAYAFGRGGEHQCLRFRVTGHRAASPNRRAWRLRQSAD